MDPNDTLSLPHTSARAVLFGAQLTPRTDRPDVRWGNRHRRHGPIQGVLDIAVTYPPGRLVGRERGGGRCTGEWEKSSVGRGAENG